MEDTILVVDDEPELCRSLERVFDQAGFHSVWTTAAAEAEGLVHKQRPACVILDLKLGSDDGFEVLAKIHKQNPRLPVIMLTAYGDVRKSVEAMKRGAWDFLTKPFDNDELVSLVQSATASPPTPNGDDCIQRQEDLQSLFGPSEEMRIVAQLVGKAACSGVTTLLMGASGTGKGFIARLIHRLSKRAAGPFVTVDCAAIPETLIESELFGHERGAFTGADRLQKGKLEQAHGGTLFLDELGNMSLPVQAKLLRFLEEHEFERVGGQKTICPDVRIIAATNSNLAQATEDHLFRLDLFYRLNEFPITLPPLCERRGDIPLLCEYLLPKICRELDREDLKTIEPEALSCLCAYHYPGNIRELRNVLKQASVMANGAITLSDLPHKVRQPQKVECSQVGLSLAEASRRVAVELEEKMIHEALVRTRGHKGRTAKLLGISERTLFNKLKAHKDQH